MKLRVFADIKIDISIEDILKENVIYCLTFTNGKKYIGQTTQELKSRIYSHCTSSLNSKSTAFNTHKAKAIRKYLSFSVNILYEGKDLDNKEIEFIKEYDTFNNGYNSDSGGIGGLTNDNRVCVEQYDLKFNLIKTYVSFMDAAKEIKPDKITSAVSAICAVANGKRKTAYGFIWKIK